VCSGECETLLFSVTLHRKDLDKSNTIGKKILDRFERIKTWHVQDIDHIELKTNRFVDWIGLHHTSFGHTSVLENFLSAKKNTFIRA
jgi:hypothetical protein